MEPAAPLAVIFLTGDLGSGTTTLIRGILKGLGYPGRVHSPIDTPIKPCEQVATGA